MNSLSTPGLVRDVRRFGTFDANACLNCGTCTIVCDLSNGSISFPRRTLRKALLGLKTSLQGSLEPWLCHDCGDCTIYCPRQAEPRQSMNTLRRYLAAQYDITGLTSKVLTSRVWGIGANVFVALLVFALALAYHLYYVELEVSDLLTMPTGMEHMFDLIEQFTIVVFAIPLLVMHANAYRMYRFNALQPAGPRIPFRHYLAEAKTIVVQMVSHKNIRKCVQAVHQKRWKKHWLLGLACTIKFVIVIFFLSWFQTDSIYPVYHPQRWLGYFVTIVLIVVPIDIIVGRIRKREEMHKISDPDDFVLPVMLLLVALSGIALHIFRYLEFALTAHFLYAVHLAVAVSLVIVELPFGKWSHVIYRPLALFFQAVKERAARETAVVPTHHAGNELATKEAQAA